MYHFGRWSHYAAERDCVTDRIHNVKGGDGMRECREPIKVERPPPARNGRAILKIDAVPEQVRVGRVWVGDWVYDHGFAAGASSAAEMIASELVTNALRHGETAGGAIEVRAFLDRGGRAVLEVLDASDRPPLVLGEDLVGEGGRGLFLVRLTTRELAWHPLRGGGKVVWCVLRAERAV
ncbi:ATP-binding protein [Actinomadura parmotrematis]|uniref:ATP-binding protein n=1 Tax=Actinomadura parmotrematis TaxID=2864039 RepID=A0ABS7FUS3_9ACTN|nr:ATP-binding protein [Actinomadura parmotrematis]MBW8484157.1 ATP-binding protein [Actinomadura parmotrematis]